MTAAPPPDDHDTGPHFRASRTIDFAVGPAVLAIVALVVSIIALVVALLVAAT